MKVRRGVWSGAEDRAIREAFGLRPLKALAARLGRSVDAVEKHALRLSPLVPGSGWTAARAERFRLSLGLLDVPALALVFGVSEAAVRARLEALAEARHPRPWTHEEDVLLARLFGHRDDDGLSLIFARPTADIVLRAKELAVAKDKAYRRRLYGFASTTMPRWSARELQTLRELYPTRPNREVAQQLGRSVKGVCSTAHRLGLRKTEERMSQMGRENIRHRRTP